MNKKGQEGLAAFLISIILIGMLILYLVKSTNPYESFKKDCREIHINNFTYETQCSVFFGEANEVQPCTKVDYDKLDEFCMNKWLENRKA